MFACLLLPVAATGTGLDCASTDFDDSARVRYVHDGDTVHLDDGRKLRLIGIDAPELARNQQPQQPFAIEARDYLRQRIKQQDNRVGLVYDRQQRDKYERTLVHLHFANGDSVQAALLNAGLAVAFTTPPNNARHACYQQAEARAQQQSSHIWTHPKYSARTLESLTSDARGFHILRALVLNIKNSAKGVWLTLEAGLAIQIKPADLDNFAPALLDSLSGKHIEVRGWLHPRKTSGATRDNSRFYLQLRHPDNLRIL